MGQEICGSRYEGIAYVTDLPSATAIEETVISNTVAKILGACREGYHDCLEREWDLLPFWLRSVTLDKEDTEDGKVMFGSYKSSFISLGGR